MVSTKLDFAEQRRFKLDKSRWRNLDTRSEGFLEWLVALLSDWGVFLQVSLYEEAVTWLLGGAGKVVRPVPIERGGRVLGRQPFHLLSPEVAFKLTALTQQRQQTESHLRRLLHHTPLKALQWVNFNRHTIELATLCR